MRGAAVDHPRTEQPAEPRARAPFGDEQVARALADARAVWPSVVVSPGQLAAFAEHAGVTAADLGTRPADLVLACACAGGDPAALALFHTLYVAGVDHLLGRLRLSPPVRAELTPALWMRLFGGNHPKIRRYSGKGPLGAWVRVVATRLAIDLRSRKDGADAAGDDLLASAVTEGLQPEVAVAQRRYRPLLEDALAQALGQLSSDDRALLRRHFVEGMNIDALAALLSIHRATAARRIVKLRKTLLAQISERLSVDLHSSASEVRSLVDALRGELELSLSRLLPAPPP
jgi:RNA polymerase sigma-70 factor (ECF subfamily)